MYPDTETPYFLMKDGRSTSFVISVKSATGAIDDKMYLLLSGLGSFAQFEYLASNDTHDSAAIIRALDFIKINKKDGILPTYGNLLLSYRKEGTPTSNNVLVAFEIDSTQQQSLDAKAHIVLGAIDTRPGREIKSLLWFPYQEVSTASTAFPVADKITSWSPSERQKNGDGFLSIAEQEKAQNNNISAISNYGQALAEYYNVALQHPSYEPELIYKRLEYCVGALSNLGKTVKIDLSAVNAARSQSQTIPGKASIYYLSTSTNDDLRIYINADGKIIDNVAIPKVDTPKPVATRIQPGTYVSSSTNSIELVLWYVRTNSTMERTRLLAHDDLPTRDAPYMEIAIPQQQSAIVSDAGAPLTNGLAEHHVVLYPNTGGITGYESESWLGFLPPMVSISSASIRVWCASAGKTKLSVALKQYDFGAMAQGDITAAQQSAWEGQGQFDVSSTNLTLYSIAIHKKEGTNQPAYSEKQMVALMIKAESGEPCMLSTGNHGNNQALPFNKILGGFGEPSIFIREGIAVPASANRAQSILSIEPSTLAKQGSNLGMENIRSFSSAIIQSQSPLNKGIVGMIQSEAKSLPTYQENLSGGNEVRVRNPNNFSVKTGIRSGQKGVDLDVPANDTRSVYIPNGRFDIYFVYSDRTDALFQGDSFTLSNNGVEIQIVKVVNGNYSIRQVK